MAKNNRDLKSLSEIFSENKQFIIPDYQRGYSWETEHLNALWEDLDNMPTTRDHYMGMFTFSKDLNDPKINYVVDGQQRITTLILLINELLKKINGGINGYGSVEDFTKQFLYHQPYGSSVNEYRFVHSDQPSNDFFVTKILGQISTSAPNQPQQTLYTKNLENACMYFQGKIAGYTQSQLCDLFLKVTTRLKFNQYIIDDINEVYVNFETMNNRGKNLSTLELLKNRLIYLTTLLAEMSPNDQTIQKNTDNLRQDINNSWKTIYSFLGKSMRKKLNDDAFLRDHWIMYFKYDRTKSQMLKKMLLSEKFTARNVLNLKLKLDEIREYVVSLQQSIIHWFNIHCPNETVLDENEKIWLMRLNRLGLGYFRPLIMAAYIKGQKNRIVDLLQACERFRFLVIDVSGRRSNTLDYHLYDLANKCYWGKSTLDDIIDDIITNTTKWLKLDNFVNNAVDRYENREGFYSWSGLRYFLYEFERQLQDASKDKKQKVDWDSFEQTQKKFTTIEHIYPQTPTDIYWTSRFYSESDKALMHSLGNLLLLSRAKNAQQQNDSFEKKKKTIYDSNNNIIYNGYDSGSHSETKVAQETEWTSREIKKRGEELLKFLIDHWKLCSFIDGFSSFNQDQIDRLLNIRINVASHNKSSVSAISLIEDVADWIRPMEESECYVD